MHDQTISNYIYIFNGCFFILGLTAPKKQPALIDFPLPNEIIEIVMAFLSLNDLLAFAAVGTERLKHYCFSFLESKLHGKCSIWENVKYYFL